MLDRLDWLLLVNGLVPELDRLDWLLLVSGLVLEALEVVIMGTLMMGVEGMEGIEMMGGIVVGTELLR